MDPSDPTYPIGAVVAYAGYLSSDIAPTGWLTCEGGHQPVTSSDFSGLYQAIGTTYGGDGNNFYLPDYRGRFLRGVDAGRGLDPDATLRSAPQSGIAVTGNAGNSVGSLQADQFTAHTHAYESAATSTSAQANKNGAMTVASESWATQTTGASGASDTRPVNLSTRFLIRASDQGITPVSTVIAYAGGNPSGLAASGWLACDGSLYSSTDASYSALFAAVQSQYGANGSMFAVPDFRGVFLRGVDGGSGHDADSSTRTQARTDLPNNGASGDSPGSYQASAVASHTHSYSLNNQYGVMKELMDDIYTTTQSTWSSAAPSCGGNEVRPVNAYVNFLICSSSGAGFELPIGAIVGCAALIADSALLADGGWMMCDGRLLPSSDYPALYETIGGAFGANGSQFALPDLRGCFLRGVDGGRDRDPDSAVRSAPRSDLPSPGNSGNAVGSFQSHSLDNHSHSYSIYATKDDKHNKQNGTAGPVAKVTTASSSTTGSSGVSGGENRPANQYVYWLIKTA